jgi:hypothetical protein
VRKTAWRGGAALAAADATDDGVVPDSISTLQGSREAKRAKRARKAKKELFALFAFLAFFASLLHYLHRSNALRYSAPSLFRNVSLTFTPLK